MTAEALRIEIAGSRRALIVAALASLLLVVPVLPNAPGATGGSDRVSVIVRAVQGSEAGVEDAVARLGGTVTAHLDIINGFTAELSRGALNALHANPAVVSVTPNADLAPTSSNYDASGDANSMKRILDSLGTRSWWDRGYTGAGIDVAVIDSGVSPVTGLNGAGKVVYGPDLSLESQAPNLRNLDTYGHGTFMAGLVAGHDATLTTPFGDAPASAYRGVAPDARIVSIKVATADGGTDVSQVIAAIDWVVQHAHDPGFNMRIINLSYGTDSLQPYTVDPLAYAAEQAWLHGIVVVAAAGNQGHQRTARGPALADPAYDPYILAVGASDLNGTPTQSDDTVPSFSASALPGVRGPDFVAPGSHIQGLRVPDSYVDVNHSGGRIGDAGDRFFRGSGTSQAAAITSGAVALILQRYPSATPDQVKALLRRSAYALPAVNDVGQMGAGELQLSNAASTKLTASTQTFTRGNGAGSLDRARGSDHLTRDGVVLTGERDIMGMTFNAAAMAALEARGMAWSGGAWNGKSWAGSTWTGNSWGSKSWSSKSWSGDSWSGASWAGNSWDGASWSDADWSGASWSGDSWSGASWATGRWS